MTVVTSGCFDIIHSGHLDLLKFCSDLAGKDGAVIVLINSDESIKKRKGQGRPINSFVNRKKMLLRLGVTNVIEFYEDHPENIIRKSFKNLDYYVKGSDYIGPMPESEIIYLKNGQIIYFEINKSYSTTKLVEKIKNGTKS